MAKWLEKGAWYLTNLWQESIHLRSVNKPGQDTHQVTHQPFSLHLLDVFYLPAMPHYIPLSNPLRDDTAKLEQRGGMFFHKSLWDQLAFFQRGSGSWLFKEMNTTDWAGFIRAVMFSANCLGIRGPILAERFNLPASETSLEGMEIGEILKCWWGHKSQDWLNPTCMGNRHVICVRHSQMVKGAVLIMNN